MGVQSAVRFYNKRVCVPGSAPTFFPLYACLFFPFTPFPNQTTFGFSISGVLTLGCNLSGLLLSLFRTPKSLASGPTST